MRRQKNSEMSEKKIKIFSSHFKSRLKRLHKPKNKSSVYCLKDYIREQHQQQNRLQNQKKIAPNLKVNKQNQYYQLKAHFQPISTDLKTNQRFNVHNYKLSVK